MTKRMAVLGTLGVLGLATGLVGGSAANADESATGKVQIVRVEYNVRGVDTSANAYLESVKVRNIGVSNPGDPVCTGQLMTGWTLEDATGHLYRFPNGYCLATGQEVNVRTGVKPSYLLNWWANPAVNLYWNRSTHMYGNASDRVTLENGGVRVDRVAWNDFTILP